MSGRGVLGAALGVKRDGEGRILSRSFSYPVSLDEGPTDFSVFAGCSDESSNDGADNWIDNVDVSRFARDVAPKFASVEVEVGNSSGRKSCLWMVNPEKKHKMDAEVKKWADKDPNGIARALSAEASSTEFKDRRPAFSRLLPLTSLEKRSPLTPRNDRVECAKLTNESFKIVKSTPVEAPTQWSKETSSRPAPTMVVDEPELIGVASPPRTPPQTSGNSGLNLLQSPSPHYPSSFESVAHALSNNSLLASAIAQSPYKGSAITFTDL